MNYSIIQLTESQMRNYSYVYGVHKCVYEMTLGEHAKDFTVQQIGNASEDIAKEAQFLMDDLRFNKNKGYPLKNASMMKFYCACRNYGGLLKDKPLPFSITINDGRNLNAFVLVLIPASAKAKLYCFPNNAIFHKEGE